jgi:hypothetical protein
MKNVFGIALAVAIATSHASAQPKIAVVEGLKFDFGDVSRGLVVERKLTVKNVGDQELVVSKVDVSCGCTGTAISKDHIKPGDHGVLNVTFNSKGFSGKVTKTVTINSNAKDEPQTQVLFTANVIEDLKVNPPQAWFKDAELGQPNTVKLMLTNQGKVPIDIMGYTTKMEGLVVRFPEKPIAPGTSAELFVEFTPKNVQPVLSNSFTLSTTSETSKELYVYVYGNVKQQKAQ